jgi:hypothetical protein
MICRLASFLVLLCTLSPAAAQDADKPLSGPVFLATGENGVRLFSQDGKTWTNLRTDREGMLLKYAAFLEGRCLVGGQYGGDRVGFVTSDGVKWEPVKFEGQAYATRLDLLFPAGNRFHALLLQDGEIPTMATSTDGKAWTPRKPIYDDKKVLRHDAHLRRFAQGSDRLVVVGDYGARLVRVGAEEKFVHVPKALAKDTLIDIAYGNGIFVGGGLHGLRMRSKDGLEWTDRTVGEEGEHINSMIFDGKQFVAIGQGATYRSPDGQTWTRTPNTEAPTVAAYANGTYVGSLWPGKLLRSTDAIRWEKTHDLPHHVLSLSHGSLGSK